MGRSLGGEFRRKLELAFAANRPQTLTNSDRDVLRDDAARVQFSRQLRRKLFGSAMFTETAWDILLTLYLADSEAVPVAAADLAERSGSPFSTTLRWLSYLDDAGLVSSVSQAEGLAAGAELSAEGRSLLDRYFIELREAEIFGSSNLSSDSEQSSEAPA
jgi:hypothetical protein